MPAGCCADCIRVCPFLLRVRVDGGQGGSGGKGGYGGNGGNGGKGGDVVIAVTEPNLALLALIECDVRGGAGGAGGSAGASGNAAPGGPGGKGGTGGAGGPAITQTTRYDDGSSRTDTIKSSGWDGSNGRDGQHGMPGQPGGDVVHGAPGLPGSDGRLEWQVLDERTGKVLTSAPDRFNAVLLSYVIVDANHDGIYEPGEHVVVSQATYANNGGLKLPAGTQLRFRGAQPIPQPELERDHAATDGHEVYVPIVPAVQPAVQPALNATYTSSFEVYGDLAVLNRRFLHSELAVQVPVQWPIRVSQLIVSPPFLGPSESSEVHITIENISQVEYGGSAGAVRVEFDCGSLLEFHPDPRLGYKAMNSSRSLVELDIDCIPAQGKVELRLPLSMGLAGLDSMYEYRDWSCRLYFRGRLIAVAGRPIRIVPTFTPACDVMLVTSDVISTDEYRAWRVLVCDVLGLTLSTWYIHRYEWMIHEEADWASSIRTVIFLVTSSCPLSKLGIADLARHFRLNPHAALLVVGANPTPLDRLLFDYRAPLHGSFLPGHDEEKDGSSQQAAAQHLAHYDDAKPDTPTTPIHPGTPHSSPWKGSFDGKVFGSQDKHAMQGLEKVRKSVQAAYHNQRLVHVLWRKELRKAGLFSSHVGDHAVFLCLYDRTARILCIDPPVLRANFLTGGQSWVPARARRTAAPLETTLKRSNFTTALLALFNLLPVPVRIMAAFDPSHSAFSRLQLELHDHKKDVDLTYSAATLFTVTLLTDIRHEFHCAKAVRGGVATHAGALALVAAIDHLPGAKEEVSLRCYAAMHRQMQKTKWKAFPWIGALNRVQRQRAELEGCMKQLLNEMPHGTKEEQRATQQRVKEINLELTPLSKLEPTLVWPCWAKRETATAEWGIEGETTLNEQRRSWEAMDRLYPGHPALVTPKHRPVPQISSSPTSTASPQSSTTPRSPPSLLMSPGSPAELVTSSPMSPPEETSPQGQSSAEEELEEGGLRS